MFVMVDKLTEMAIYQLHRNNIDHPESPQMMFENMINKHSLANHLVMNLGTQFASGYWSQILSFRSINHQPSAACDSYTNRKPEWHNLSLDQCLWSLSNYEWDNRVEFLPLVEFPYQNSGHDSARMLPFWAMFHRNPALMYKIPTVSHPQLENQVDPTLDGSADTPWTAFAKILDAQQQDTRNGCRKEIMFNIWDTGEFSIKHFRTFRISKIFDCQSAEPFTVSEVINVNAFKSDLLKMMRNYVILHISWLDWYTPPVSLNPWN